MEALAQLQSWQKQAIGNEKASANMDVALRLLRHGAEAIAEIDRLRAELAECRNATAEDALRYAFIRAKHAADDDCWYVCGVGEADGDILDAKIDEARKGEGE